MTEPGRAQPVRFDEALKRTKDFMGTNASMMGAAVVVIRDLYGRITLAIDGQRQSTHERLAHQLDRLLGAYSPGVDNILMFRLDFFAPDAIFKAEDAIPLVEGQDTIRLLERQVTAQDWLRQPLHKEGLEASKRIAFFGIKGGIGRSTALAVLAWKLAQLDKKVLIVDLDLESPGISTTLLPIKNMPDYGVVDWLVEDAVGQADESLLQNMIQVSPLMSEGAGVVRVVPAGGRTGDYLAKLSRAYMSNTDVETQREREFAERLDAMIAALEAQERPDVVLLDSRAGLHDDAAATVTRLGATAFLFAANTSQTWHAYELLFKNWKRSLPVLRNIRQNLKIVEAMIPDTDRDRYKRDFLESSYQLFQSHLYDQQEPGDLNAFNYDIKDDTGPHYPLEVYWSRPLQEFDPVRRPEAVHPDQLQAAFGGFLRGTAALLGMDG